MALYIRRLAKQRKNDRNRWAEQRKKLRKGVSLLILLYSVVAIALQYSHNTHTDYYTLCIIACDHEQVCTHDACNICLVITINVGAETFRNKLMNYHIGFLSHYIMPQPKGQTYACKHNLHILTFGTETIVRNHSHANLWLEYCWFRSWGLIYIILSICVCMFHPI